MDQWKAISLLLVGILLGGTGYALSQPARASNGTIRAERFEVVDAGVVRASIGVSPDTGASDIRLYDAKGKEKATLSVLAGGAASLYFRDRDQMLSMNLETGGMAPRASSLYLCGSNGENVAMTVLHDGQPPEYGLGSGFSLWDKNNRPRGGSYLDKHGNAVSYGK